MGIEKHLCCEYICDKCNKTELVKMIVLDQDPSWLLPEDWTIIPGFIDEMVFCPECSKRKTPDQSWMKN